MPRSTFPPLQRHSLWLGTFVRLLQVLVEAFRSCLRLVALGAGVRHTRMFFLLLGAPEHLHATEAPVVNRSHSRVLPDVVGESLHVWDVRSAELARVIHGVLFQHVHFMFLRVREGRLAEFTENFGTDGVRPQLSRSVKVGVAVSAEPELIRASLATFFRAGFPNGLLQQLRPVTRIENTVALIN